MAFHKFGKTEKFPVNDDVDIVVREVTLNADAPESAHVPCIEIREFLREPEIYGHGLVIPRASVACLKVALDRLPVKK